MTHAMRDCDEARDLLDEHRRGDLPAEAAARVEAHLASCPACRALRARDDALVALLRALPVTPAAPALRRRLAGADGPSGRGRRWLGTPWVTAGVAALLVLAALSPWLPWRRDRAPDPVEGLVASGVTEHERILLELEGQTSEVADPASAFARVYQATDIRLPPAFGGGGDDRLVAARPTLLANRKAAAAVLRSPPQSVTTYFALPGKDLPMPTQGRVQIEQYQPYMRELKGYRAIYWKQGDLAFLMVTDLDDPGSRQLFLRMRKAL